jgi:beta-glucosidase
MTKRIPDGFTLGVATSAFQIEGAWNEDGKGPSIWDVFSQTPGRVHDNVPGDAGVDHYHRWREDVAILKDLGVDSYRFSLSWARLLPAGTGEVNQAGLDFYNGLIDALLEAGIEPNATLYHWDLPQALEERGGWANRDIADWFAEYAALAFSSFGDRVRMWATLNEPIAIWVGYGLGGFAPGVAEAKVGKQAMHNAMLAHGRAVREFRKAGSPGQIGIVVDVWKRYPLTDSAADAALARRDENDSFRFFFDEIFRGRLDDENVTRLIAEGTLPEILPGDGDLTSEPIDYLGLNVYSRVIVDSENYRPEWWDSEHAPGGNYLSNSTELYPRVLRDAVEVVRYDYGVDVPIYITENGTSADAEPGPDGGVHDAERIDYLHAFLAQALDAHDAGLDVRGYYAWSLIDNYEWGAGYSMRYGLVRATPPGFDRCLKASGRWYREVNSTRTLIDPQVR